jgi:hypothetical protein
MLLLAETRERCQLQSLCVIILQLGHQIGTRAVHNIRRKNGKCIKFSVYRTEDKEDKKLDHSHCWMKETKKPQSKDQSANSRQV